MVINAVYPAIGDSAGAMASITGKMDDRLKSQVSIIHATGELNASGQWVDTDSDGKFDIFAWLKNVGASRIIGIDQSDVFFGQEGNFSRIPYVSDAGGQYPRWEYQLENGSEWTNTATLKVKIHYSSALTQGTYFFKFIIPNGISDEDYFSM